MTLTPTKAQGGDSERLAQTRRDWECDTARLADDVQTWAGQAAARGWRAERAEKGLAEEIVGGAYRVPVVTIYAPQGRLVLEPIARGTMGAQGRVDLYAWPSRFRVMLLHRDGEWVARTESGIDWPQAWGRETFLTLAEGLLKA